MVAATALILGDTRACCLKIRRSYYFGLARPLFHSTKRLFQRHLRQTFTKERTISLSTAISGHVAKPVLPRARGEIRLSVKSVGQRTALENLRQSGSVKCLFPRGSGPGIEAVLINTAGGITGGDDFRITATAGKDTSLTLTTQAAERIYQSAPGECGHMTTRLKVAAGARLNWLPQETILFNKCSFARSLTLDLAPGASALLVEPLVFGRVTMGETLTSGDFRDRIEIRHDDQLMFVDALHLTGDIHAHLARPHIASCARAMALIVLISPDADARVAQLRPMMPEHGGVSLVRDNMLVARILAADSFELRQSLVPVLNSLTQDNVPKCWMI